MCDAQSTKTRAAPAASRVALTAHAASGLGLGVGAAAERSARIKDREAVKPSSAPSEPPSRLRRRRLTCQMCKNTSVSRQPRRGMHGAAAGTHAIALRRVPLPAFACFLERTRFVQAAASLEDAVKTPRSRSTSTTDWAVSHIAVGALPSSAAPMPTPPTVSPVTSTLKHKQFGVGMCSPALAIEAAFAHSPQNSTPHQSTRRSLLRLAPAQVRTGEDGCPLLRPVMQPPQPSIASRRYLKDHQRCEIVLRVRSGERQAHLAKEFGISRAAVSYLLRHQSQVLSKFTKKHAQLHRQSAT